MYVFPLPRKIMKKCSSKVLAMAMVVAMMVPGMNVMAATTSATGNVDNETTTCDTNVKYEVTEAYEWTIHSEIDFDKDKGVNTSVEKTGNKVSVSKNVIPDGKKLNIAAGTNTGSKDLTFTLKTGNGTAEVAGKYSGTVTYTASVVNATENAGN